MAYFSRVELDRRAPAKALLPLLNPSDPGARLDAHHRLIWTLFPSPSGQKRDFLWRTDGDGRFYILSHRQPELNDLFRPFMPKTFEPDLKAGDKLAFLLRANATKTRPHDKLGADKRHRRVDVVMHALKSVPGLPQNPPADCHSKRAEQRFAIARHEGEKWLKAQGSRHGFTVEDFMLEDYSTIPLPRPGRPQGRREQEPKFGILDMRGILAVTDPAAFIAKLLQGFGRAKGFGCGLMMIRRV